VGDGLRSTERTGVGHAGTVDPAGAPPDPEPEPQQIAGPRVEAARLRAERRARYTEWAIEAERATGRRERSPDNARRNVWVRVGVIATGTLVTLAGIGMLVLPGPGIVVLIAGLGLLAREVAWAERLLAYAKRKAKVDKIADQAPWVKPVALVMTVVAVGVSVAYTVRWR